MAPIVRFVCSGRKAPFTGLVIDTVGGGMVTLIVTAEEVFVPNQLSTARAVNTCGPTAGLVQIKLNGELPVCTSDMPSAKISNCVMLPSLSVAVAVTVTFDEAITLVLFVGAVMFTVGQRLVSTVMFTAADRFVAPKLSVAFAVNA